MLTREVAKYRIQDDIDAAQRDRIARSARVERRRERALSTRVVGSGMLAAVTGRRRKRTPTSAPIGMPLS